jgi:hypothetical protein
MCVLSQHFRGLPGSFDATDEPPGNSRIGLSDNTLLRG